MFTCLHIHTKGSSHYKIRLLLVTNQRFTSGPGWMNTEVNICLQIVPIQQDLKKKKREISAWKTVSLTNTECMNECDNVAYSTS